MLKVQIFGSKLVVGLDKVSGDHQSDDSLSWGGDLNMWSKFHANPPITQNQNVNFIVALEEESEGHQPQ